MKQVIVIVENVVAEWTTTRSDRMKAKPFLSQVKKIDRMIENKLDMKLNIIKIIIGTVALLFFCSIPTQCLQI